MGFFRVKIKRIELGFAMLIKSTPLAVVSIKVVGLLELIDF
jgi:hypothetical protein